MITLMLLALIITGLIQPNCAFADGGGPLLLIINGLSFLYGGVLIIAVEWYLYVRLARLQIKQAFWDALLANLASTVLIGFGVPLLIATVSVAVSFALPKTISEYALAFGTWVFEGIRFPKIAISSTIFWWMATFFLTVYVEKIVLQKRWNARNYRSEISASELSWRSNIVTYIGILIAVISSFVWDNYIK